MIHTVRVLSVVSACVLMVCTEHAFALQYFTPDGPSSPPSPVASQRATSSSPMMSGGSPAVGYEIHLQAPHMMEDGTVGGPYHHYCKGISPKILQCLLFESTASNAPLVAVEYFEQT